ncbi:MAG: hypothetical protein IPL28_25330 [Chloroflexi bacterium]|nr:hypothetical protein [Chloroflexota bacterium]
MAATNARLHRELEEHHRTAVQLIEARDRAEEASRAKSAFLTNVSHELRTPLNAIIGYSELVLDEAQELGHSEYTDDLGRILWSARHLLGIVNDILDLAKIEAGKLDAAGEFQISAVIQVITMAARPLIERRNNQLVVECPADLPILYSDEQKVRQILLNLLSNAANLPKWPHSADGGAGGDGPSRCGLVCTVADTGIGMSAAEQEQLFQPFTQLDASPSRLYEGTGLGLTISRHFCHMLGGHIEVNSQAGPRLGLYRAFALGVSRGVVWGGLVYLFIGLGWVPCELITVYGLNLFLDTNCTNFTNGSRKDSCHS